jgi:hypothetical protein
MIKRLLGSPFPVIALSTFLICLPLGGCATAAEIAPRITFIMPPGNVYGIGDLPVSVSVANFTVVDKQGQAAVAGEGHLHYYLDVDAPAAPGKPAIATPGTWVTTASKSYTWHNVGSGSHRVSVELVNNDHTPLNPPVVATTTVTVVPEPGDPRIVILSPLGGISLKAGDLTVSVEVNNFSLSEANEESPPILNEGQVFYFMDIQAPTDPGKQILPDSGVFASTTDTTYTFKNVAPGSHTIWVELANDDGTPLTPAVVATITVVVTA